MRNEIDHLCDAMVQDGAYLPLGEASEQALVISYTYPNGRCGDIDHAIARAKAHTIEVENGVYRASFFGRDFLDMAARKGLRITWNATKENVISAKKWVVNVTSIKMICQAAAFLIS